MCRAGAPHPATAQRPTGVDVTKRSVHPLEATKPLPPDSLAPSATDLGAPAEGTGPRPVAQEAPTPAASAQSSATPQPSRIPKGQPGAGRLLPGHSLHPQGRKAVKDGGTPNKATILREQTVRQIIRGAAQKAARKLVEGLDDPNPWVAYACAKSIIERLPPEHEDLSAHWVEYLHPREVAQLESLLKRGMKREKAAQQAPALPEWTGDGAQVIDVTPTPPDPPAPPAPEPPVVFEDDDDEPPAA